MFATKLFPKAGAKLVKAKLTTKKSRHFFLFLSNQMVCCHFFNDIQLQTTTFLCCSYIIRCNLFFFVRFVNVGAADV